MLLTALVAVAINDTNHASLLVDTSRLESAGILDLGVYLQPAQGSHTYWMNPGDSGGPTSFSLQLPKGFTTMSPKWPAPSRLDLSGVISYGYDSPQLVEIPVKVEKKLRHGHVQVVGRLKWLVCTTEICKSADQNLFADISLNKGTSKATRLLFSASRRNFPRNDTEFSVHAQGDREGYQLEIAGPWKASPPGNLYFFPMKGGMIDHGKTQTMTLSGKILRIRLAGSPYASKKLQRLVGVLAASDLRTNHHTFSPLMIDVPVE